MKTLTVKIKVPTLNGTISTAYAKCGKSSCKCLCKKNCLHGPYYRWTGFIKGKRTTITLSKKMASECQKRINNYKNFQKQISKILNQALSSAPWNK